jgi:hypothetical protein
MNEGWYGDEYLILFDPSEISSASIRYGIAEYLSGYEIVGLRGWDDFILRDSRGKTYSVPPVPLDPEYISPFQLPRPLPKVQPDPRTKGKIKWYVKPIVFGGDPNLGDNVFWVDHKKHGQLVKWWNQKYFELKGDPEDE